MLGRISIRRATAAVVFGLTASLLAAVQTMEPASAAPSSPATLTESFTDATMVSPSDWYMSYSGQKPCLSGITSAQSITLSNTTISGCGAVADAAGQGALLLSRNTANNASTMLYNKEISTAAGLDVQFFEAQYGGSGADGISFFTKLGSQTDLSVGLPGGGLGYVGVKDGLFGVGFDDWLNWTRWDLTLAPGEQLGGMLCPGHVGEINGYMNSLGIRGPDVSAGHDGTSGYCLLNSVEMGAGYFGGAAASRQSAARPVRIVVDPASATTPKIRVYIWQSGGLGQDIATANFTLEADEPAQYKSASTFKFGFAASTGAYTNNHAIWGLAIAPKDVAAATTYYAVPQSLTIAKGATPTYGLKYYKDAAHTQEFTPGGLTAPTCTSPYVPASSAAGTYTISCTGGSVTLAKLQIDGTATLTVTKPPVSITPATQTVSGTVGTALAATTAYTASNFTPTTYSVSPALPTGLAISSATGVVSGTPTAVSAAANYTVSATDGTDTATATINVTVTETPKYAYTITFNANGGTGTMASLSGTASEVQLPVNTFTRRNRTFKGWDSSDSRWFLNADIVRFSAPQNLTLTARWDVVTPVSIAPTPQTVNGTVNSLITPTTAYTATGFTPTRYTVAPALPQGLTLSPTTGVITGTPTAVSSSAAYTVSATDDNDTATATVNIGVVGQTKYAYTVRFDKNGGSGTQMPDLTGTEASVKLSKNTYTRTNRTFAGWKDEAGVSYTDEQVVALSKATTIYLYAQWTVTNAVSITPETQTVTAITGTAITPTAKYVTKNFTGTVSYSIAPGIPAGLAIDPQTGSVSGTPTAVTPSTKYTVTATDGVDTATATIDFTVTSPTKYKYAVTFNPNSGTGTMADQSGDAPSFALTPNAFTRTGYKFAGWKDSAGTAYADAQTVVLTAPTTLVLTAQWAADGGGSGGGSGSGGGGAIAYAISFEANGGSGTMAGITGTGAASIVLTKNAFTSPVMKWVGWQDDAGVSYTDAQTIQISKSTSLVLHAQWEMNESNVGSFTKPAPVRPGATQPVSFARNSNALSAISNAVLKKWNLKTVAAITIAGYVEPAGSSANDFPLSLKRAKAVALVMAKKYKGIRIKTIGMGRQIAKKCRPFKNKCAYITIMVMKNGQTIKG